MWSYISSILNRGGLSWMCRRHCCQGSLLLTWFFCLLSLFVQSKCVHFLKQFLLFVWPARLSMKTWSYYVETSIVFFCFKLSVYERNCLQCRRLVFFYITSLFAFDRYRLLLSRSSFTFLSNVYNIRFFKAKIKVKHYIKNRLTF